MGKVMEKFSGHLSELTHSEKHVLYYIEDHLEQAKTMPLTKMAEANSVSTTTIVRMCHKLGLDGFAELKYILKTIDATIMPTDQNPVERYVTDITNSLETIAHEDLEEIAGLMKGANRIVILSVGLTKMAGEYLSKRLMQLNQTSTYIYESHMIDLISNWIGRDDLVIFLSSSGETETLLNAADKIGHLNVPSVSVTNDPDSTLRKLTTHGVSAPVQKVTYVGYDVSARSTLVMLCDLIFEYVLKLVADE
ncbi:MurR/RpiR family transcriptional regulator [Halobacillus salinus]|uniref:MurR/RpiR family transcriptional regulator n=1 Tax=Halobacillus salinus TaxID=192814 RepID=A0A4Z0GTN6_9BACI|nr:MurR/RpiR family transcriptional regulator [Halobacillus salinus]TGB00757.1 MurR/RpiR family transcriptional regulator [Halobacillus salinus]